MAPSSVVGPDPLAGFWGRFAAEGRGWAGEEEGKREGKGREGKWRGVKGRAPKLLLNQGPSEHCYATARPHSSLPLIVTII